MGKNAVKGRVSFEIRKGLAVVLRAWLTHHHITQAEAARLIGTYQAQVNEICAGRIEGYTIDRLVEYLARIGIKADLAIDPKAIRAKPLRRSRGAPR